MPTPGLARGGNDLVLDRAVEQVPLDLRAAEPRPPLVGRHRFRVADVLAGHVRRREVEHLALAHERVERLQRFLDRPDRVRVVLVVHVDVISGEALEADLDAGADARREDAGRVLLVAGPGEELRRDHDVVAPAAERGGEELLRLASAVHLGGVEVGDALVERSVHDRTRRVLVDAHAEVVAPEAHHREQRPVGSERASVHGRASTGRERE